MGVGVYGSGDVVDNAPHDNDEGSYGGALFVNVSCCLSLFFFSLENMGVGVYGDISVMDNALHDNDEGSYGGSIFLVVSLSLHVLHIFFSYLSWCKNCLRKNIGVVVMSWTMPPPHDNDEGSYGSKRGSICTYSVLTNKKLLLLISIINLNHRFLRFYWLLYNFQCQFLLH